MLLSFVVEYENLTLLEVAPSLPSLEGPRVTSRAGSCPAEGLFLKAKYQPIIWRPNYIFISRIRHFKNDWTSSDGSTRACLELSKCQLLCFCHFCSVLSTIKIILKSPKRRECGCESQ